MAILTDRTSSIFPRTLIWCWNGNVGTDCIAPYLCNTVTDANVFCQLNTMELAAFTLCPVFSFKGTFPSEIEIFSPNPAAC